MSHLQPKFWNLGRQALYFIDNILRLDCEHGLVLARRFAQCSAKALPATSFVIQGTIIVYYSAVITSGSPEPMVDVAVSVELVELVVVAVVVAFIS